MDYSPRYGQLRATLRSIREEAGLTQAQLAARIGKPQTFISKSELGERRVDFWEVVDICLGCGISVSELLPRLEDSVETAPVERLRRQSPRRMDRAGVLRR